MNQSHPYYALSAYPARIEDGPRCPGTQDYVSPIVFLQFGLPDDFEAIVSERIGALESRIHPVFVNRTRVGTGDYYGQWDWIVCREARRLAKEVEHAVAFISARKACKQTGQSKQDLFSQADWKSERGRIYFDRHQLGLPAGRYPRKASRRARIARLLNGHEAPIHKAGTPSLRSEMAAHDADIIGPDLTLGGIIFALRKKQRKSQAEFGRNFGVSQVAVSRWEKNDDVPSPKVLVVMAKHASDPTWINIFYKSAGLSELLVEREASNG